MLPLRKVLILSYKTLIDKKWRNLLYVFDGLTKSLGRCFLADVQARMLSWRKCTYFMFRLIPESYDLRPYKARFGTNYSSTQSTSGSQWNILGFWGCMQCIENRSGLASLFRTTASRIQLCFCQTPSGLKSHDPNILLSPTSANRTFVTLIPLVPYIVSSLPMARRWAVSCFYSIELLWVSRMLQELHMKAMKLASFIRDPVPSLRRFRSWAFLSWSLLSRQSQVQFSKLLIRLFFVTLRFFSQQKEKWGQTTFFR